MINVCTPTIVHLRDTSPLYPHVSHMIYMRFRTCVICWSGVNNFSTTCLQKARVNAKQNHWYRCYNNWAVLSGKLLGLNSVTLRHEYITNQEYYVRIGLHWSPYLPSDRPSSNPSRDDIHIEVLICVPLISKLKMVVLSAWDSSNKALLPYVALISLFFQIFELSNQKQPKLQPKK